MRFILFAHPKEHSSILFKNIMYHKLLKLAGIIKLNNILFTHNSINNNTPTTFKDYLTIDEISQHHDTVNSLNSYLKYSQRLSTSPRLQN